MPAASSIDGPSSGSNAGRGFRYQDLYGALLVTRMYVGNDAFSAITPEGADDYEIRFADGIILADTKSNRPEARPRSESDDAASLRKLWTRPVKPGAQVSEYWLVTERSRDGGVVAARNSAASLFAADSAEAKRSYLLIEPDPLRAATRLLAHRRGITPLAAELIVLAFARQVGDLASANGAVALDQRSAVTAGDAERIAGRVLAAVDADRLERLLRSGFVTPPDLLTPLNDAGFYLGVDVEPGHFAAGLALERPHDAARIAEALKRTRTVLVKGPSGAGKSGLMWNAVIATREERRWFRVNKSIAPEDEALTAFFTAYGDTPVGFVIDDIGRGGVEAWNALRPRCEAHGEAVLLGSIRTEDASLLPARHAIAEIDARADEQLARALWTKLRERNQTSWAGWREPWADARGLLLEYGHILTRNGRLESVILDQIRTRLSEKRDDELKILSAAAPVAVYGGSVNVATLRDHLGLSAGDMARALERLVAEHLVRVDASGSQLTGLHALRAAAICSALNEVNFATPDKQANDAIAVADGASLQTLIAGLIASGGISDEAAAEAAGARLQTGTRLPEIAASIRGLRAGLLTLAARSWLASLQAAGIPRKLATSAALMSGIRPEDMPDIGDMRKLVVHGNRLLASVAAQRFPVSLATSLIRALREGADHAAAEDLVDALSALARAPLTPEQIAELGALRPELDARPLSDVVRILDAAESINPEIAAVWVVGRNHRDLLERLHEETPCALPLAREETADGLIVHGDICEAALGPGEEPNDRLVAHVDAIMRLEPRAARAHVRLVDMNGALSLHPDAEKRMPRASAPPKALAQSNRRVIDVVAQEVASESWSRYLALGEDLLRRGLRALERLLDGVMVGRVNQQALDALNEVVTACDDLIAPSDPPDPSRPGKISGRHLTPLQNLVFEFNGQLVRRIAQLPEGAGALAGYAEDLCKRAEAVRDEPWSLIRDAAPRELSEVQNVLRKIELVALEAAASGLNPRERWRKANGKPKDAFELVFNGSRRAFLQRIETRRAALAAIVERELPGAVLKGPTPADGIMWRSRFVATFPLASFDDFKRWTSEARIIGERLRAQLEDGEDMVLVPLLNGCAAPDFAYELNRGRPDSMVAPILTAAGQTSLLAAPHQSVIDRLEAPVIRHPPELERLAQAVRDFIGMHQLGLGGPGRPAAERERFVQACSALTVEGPRLLGIFDGIDHPAIDALAAFLNLVVSETPEHEIVAPPLTPGDFQNALAEMTWRHASTRRSPPSP